MDHNNHLKGNTNMARTIRRSDTDPNYDFNDRELVTRRKPVRKQDRTRAARDSIREAALDAIYFNQTDED